MHNLASKSSYAKIKAQLWTELQKTLRAQRDPRILGNGDIFDTYKYLGNRDHAWDTMMEKKKN